MLLLRYGSYAFTAEEGDGIFINTMDSMPGIIPTDYGANRGF